MPKQKYDINSEWFHDQYLIDHKPLNTRIATSKQLYTQILKHFFEYIKERLYAGECFSTPIGDFQITRINIIPKKRVSHAATNKATAENKTKTIVYRALNKLFYYKLTYTANNGLGARYIFKVNQSFSRRIHEYYE